jgi:hypothetical protein
MRKTLLIASVLTLAFNAIAKPSLQGLTESVSMMVYYNNKCGGVTNLNRKIDNLIYNSGHVNDKAIILSEVRTNINNWDSLSPVQMCNRIKNSATYTYFK